MRSDTEGRNPALKRLHHRVAERARREEGRWMDAIKVISMGRDMSADADGMPWGAVFQARDYDALCEIATEANEPARGRVSLVLPVMASEFRQGSAPSLDAAGSEFMAMACLDLSPHTAFELASGLPLAKSARSALEDNGLTLQGLTLRESILGED